MKIQQIKFGMFSPEQIRKMSVAKIVTPDTHDSDGYPIKRGLMDLRLGVIDPGLRCRTCRNRAGRCPGHFGHIELARPVVHVGYAKLILNILRSTCHKCGKVVLDDKKRKEFKNILDEGIPREIVGQRAFKAARNLKKCPFCGESLKDIKYEKPTSYLDDIHRIMPNEIRDWLEKIPEEDLYLIGFKAGEARPEWMILTALPVPPVTTRPSITLESGERSEDDLTHKLVDIIRLNQRLAENIDAGAPQLIIEDQWDLVQYHATTYFDNEVSGVPPARHRSGRPLKTITQRLKGKEGRFRHSLAGKRVDFSARTVISPDSNISINEVGVPLIIAQELTTPEKVTPSNLKKLKKLVANGTEYPGANYLIDVEGKRKKITSESAKEIAEELTVGYIVDRHLVDGDVVLFNRQPSLHRMSIMAHKVRVMPGKTFRLHLCVCPPYNADFDGDEMNLHVPQTEEARTEAKFLMEVQTQIRSPRFGGPIIGCIHDHISGSYMLTKKGVLLSKEEAYQLLKVAGIDNIKLPKPLKDNKYSGKQVFSQLLPKEISVEYKAKWCRNCDVCLKEKCEFDSYVKIKNGKLLCGIIDEKSIGAFSGRLIDEVNRISGEEARLFLDRVSRMSTYYLMIKGFSTGIEDEDLPKEIRLQIKEVIEQAEKKVDKIIERYENGKLEPHGGITLEETLEELVMVALNEGRDKTGVIAENYLKEDNCAAVMARAGARGNILNITQMSACIGQQAIRGKRVQRGYADRTLPHFAHGSLRAKACGFVSSSYKGGMSPIEFFFHAMGGRESLTDTAMRTPKSGYMQRRLINALQDLKVCDDYTVKDNREVIVQFDYGEDRVNPAKTEWGTINVRRVLDKL